MNSPLIAPQYFPIQLDRQWLSHVFYNTPPNPVFEYLSEDVVFYYCFRYGFEIAQDRASWVYVQNANPEYYSGEQYLDDIDELLHEVLGNSVEVGNLSVDRFSDLHSDIMVWLLDRIQILSEYLESTIFPIVDGIRSYLRQLQDWDNADEVMRFVVHDFDRNSGILVIMRV